MKKDLLQNISDLCCFALDDKECLKFQRYLILENYASAKLFLNKIIENIEWTFAFDKEDENLKKQLIDSNKLMNLVVKLTIVDERNKQERKQIREVN